MRISVLGPRSLESAVGDAVRHTDLSVVCVDLMHLRPVCEEIGRALATHEGAPVIVVRTTVPPGTMRDVVVPVLEKYSGKKAGEEFGVCIYPEPLQDGSALIGELNRASGAPLAALEAARLGRMIRTDLDTAEVLKYADVAWHALKLGFANEIGVVCKSLGVDAHRVMETFSREDLKPGFSFPKDLPKSLSLPILSAIVPSKELQLERAFQAVTRKGNKKVGILG